MIRYMPGRRDIRWLIWGLIYLVILWAVLLLNRYLALGSSFHPGLALRILLLAAIVSAVVNLCGYFGARWMWTCTTVGIAAGLVMMFQSLGGSTGWEDLIGFMNFLLLSVIGFGVGILAQLLALLVIHLRRNNSGN